MSVNIRRMRAVWNAEPFLEKHLSSLEPIGQFDAWFREATLCDLIKTPNATCLSTANREGRVSARYVLLKEYGKEGFKIFTYYTSQKGQDIAENPYVALTFYWEALARSIRIEGNAEKVSDEESENYFHERPLAGRLAAAASRQSEVIASRDVLCTLVRELEAQYGDAIPHPDGWGGYVIRPTMVEFIQNQPDRLTDRIRFRRPNKGDQIDGALLHQGEDGWVYERLQP